MKRLFGEEEEMEGFIILPYAEKVTVGIFEDRYGEVFTAGQRYPGIIFLYEATTTHFLIELMKKLGANKADLLLVNFERVQDKINIVVWFEIKRKRKKWLLTAEVDIDTKTVEEFKEYLKKTKQFVICLGFSEAGNLIVPCTDWYVLVESFDEYDRKSVHNYICGRFH